MCEVYFLFSINYKKSSNINRIFIDKIGVNSKNKVYQNLNISFYTFDDEDKIFIGSLTDAYSNSDDILNIVVDFEINRPKEDAFQKRIVVDYVRFVQNDEVYMNYTVDQNIELSCRLMAIYCSQQQLEQNGNRYKFNKGNDPIFIGHRGLGADNLLKENTIGGFNRCAKLGVKFCELDVIFTKDEEMIIYHDFHLGEKTAENEIRQMTYDEVRQKLSNKGEWTLCPKLEQVLQKVDPKVGLFVEFKFPQLIGQLDKKERENLYFSNDSREYYFPRNYYVDKVLKKILEYLPKYPREIALLSFDSDLSLMLKLKQSIFPVFQVTRGGLLKDILNHTDPRMNTLSGAVKWSEYCGLDAVVTRYELVSKEELKSLIQRKLLVFCYGKIPLNKETMKLAKDFNLTGLIIDDVENFMTTYYVR